LALGLESAMIPVMRLTIVPREGGGVMAGWVRIAKPEPIDKVGYQFRVTLVESRPPIWRRILVPEGTLDELHEWIQTAMGWTNSHLHQFQIGKRRYGDPDLLETDLYDEKIYSTLDTELAELFDRPRPVKRLLYEYDFGDGWEHKVEFEGRVDAPPRKRPPLCLDGSRACPPEDSGGMWGYEHMLTVVADPSHEEHADYVEWLPEGFDPEAFDPAAATRRMRRGLPDWRQYP
jgi:Plasmid pRiA4b ORF-3-like protein